MGRYFRERVTKATRRSSIFVVRAAEKLLFTPKSLPIICDDLDPVSLVILIKIAQGFEGHAVVGKFLVIDKKSIPATMKECLFWGQLAEHSEFVAIADNRILARHDLLPDGRIMVPSYYYNLLRPFLESVCGAADEIH